MMLTPNEADGEGPSSRTDVPAVTSGLDRLQGLLAGPMGHRARLEVMAIVLEETQAMRLSWPFSPIPLMVLLHVLPAFREDRS